MDENDTQILQKILERTEENYKILRHMQNAARWGRAWSAIKLIFYIATAVVAYYYLQPYIQKVNNLYSQAQKVQQGADPASLQKSLKDLINQIPGLGSGNQTETANQKTPPR